jgi:hypothetical protein
MRDTYDTRQRRGFVLLTVTLVGALLFISALMFVSQLTTESHVTKTDAYFKSALNIAETGLSNMLMDISQSKGTETWAVPFANGTTTVRLAEADGAVHGTYQETVQAIGTLKVIDATDPYNVVYSRNIQVTSIGVVYPPSVPSIDMAGNGAYVARRAVRSNAVAVWTHSQIWSEAGEPDTFAIRYGIFTGGNLVIKGSSQEIRGDVFANGDVYIQKASGLVGGDAFAVGTVTGGIPPGDKFGGQTPIPFPEMDIASLQKQFDAYLRGVYPYDGTVFGRTDTSDSVLGKINRGIYKVDQLVTAARTDLVTGLYELPSMVPITADVRSALIDPTAVYYFDGDVKLASNSALAGTIVIDGKFFIAGNVEVGTAGTMVNIIATGDVTKDTGCSLINGVVYTGGSFTGRGTADINGALIARNSVDMSGNFNVTYKSGLPGLPVDGDYDKPHLVSEAYTLDGLNRLPSGERMWQEVTDLN